MEPVQVLDRQRLVETQLGLEGPNRVWGGVLTQQCDRQRSRSERQQCNHQEGRKQHNRDRTSDASQREAQHRHLLDFGACGREVDRRTRRRSRASELAERGGDPRLIHRWPARAIEPSASESGVRDRRVVRAAVRIQGGLRDGPLLYDGAFAKSKSTID